jgi:hypothetical protein
MSDPVKNFISGSEYWLNSENLSFSEILNGSNLPDKWRRYDLLESEFDECLLRPVNRYVSNLYPRPELVHIEENNIILRQKTHAEIWVKPRTDSLYALDKTWQRQFYPSKNRYIKDGCFDATYRFYMPWFIDSDATGYIYGCSDSPFSVDDQVINFNKELRSSVLDAHFVDFKIKTEGKHMIDERYGIIDIGTPMYDIHITLSENNIKRIEEQYGVR